MINSNRIWAKPIRYNKYETIYDGQRIISKNAIINNWSYVIKVRVNDSEHTHYGLAKSAHTAVKWKPKSLRYGESFTREVHIIQRFSGEEETQPDYEEDSEQNELHSWHSPLSKLPKLGNIVIVKRYHPDFGVWEEQSAWSGRVFLCDLYGCSKVLQWRNITTLD